ncbi:MAG: bis-aminopropyl spermidine synthase family protein [Candidatus Micrarchaeaceae archaeon]
MYNKVIENAYELELYKKIHHKILIYLNFHGWASFYDILLKCGGSDRRVLRLLDQMVKNGELIAKNGRFSTPGRKIASYDRLWKSATIKYKESLSIIKFKPTFIFDQRPINYTSKLRRAKKLISDIDLYKVRNLAFLGDDDLVSILTALIFKDKKIWVFDIDPRIINLIKEIAIKQKLKNLIAIKHDFSKPTPKGFSKKFDAFVTDPSPAPAYFKMFLSAAKDMTKTGGIGYISFYPSHTELFLDHQKILTDLNFVIVEMLDRYTEYSWIEATYSKNDIKLLEKYKINKHSIINFYESLAKVALLGKNYYQKNKIKSKLPNAMKRVYKDISKDPGYADIMQNNELYELYKKVKAK